MIVIFKRIKKGFTLIELLAVIVVLGIVSAIGIYTVSEVIHTVKKDAFIQNVRTLIRNAENSFIISNFEKQNNDMLFSNISTMENAIKLDADYNYNYKIKFLSNNGSITGYYAINNDEFSTYGEIPISDIVINEKFISANLVLFTDKGITLVENTNIEFYKNLPCDDTYTKKGYITYEDFYAVGDGKTNDANAIYYAHACANKLNIPIKANKGTYYISNLNDISSIIIKTDVDWNNSTIIIDDTVINDTERSKSLFTVQSDIVYTPNMELNYSHNTKTVPDIINYIKSRNSNNNDKFHIGLTSKTGKATDKIYRATGSMTIFQEFEKSDFFRIDENGNVLDNIRYNYEGSVAVTMRNISEKKLKLENGNFVTIPEKCTDNPSCKSTARYIKIIRSNVEINNFNHYFLDDDKKTNYGSGILLIIQSADVTIKNSNFRPHISTGYDISLTNSTNITFDNVGYTCNPNETIKECYYKTMIDDKHVGITGNNNVKNWTIKNSKLNRLDSHQPSQNIVISNSILGFHGINVIGEGKLDVIDTSVDQSDHLVLLRTDYGGTWNGTINLNNIYFNTRDYKGTYPTAPRILRYAVFSNFNLENGGFGYPLYIPAINASNIFIDEKNLAKSMTEYHKTDYTKSSSGIILVQNYANNIIDVNNELVQDQKATLLGSMNFHNIRSDTFDKLKINNVFIGNNTSKTYIEKNKYGNITSSKPWGVDRMNINNYKNTNPIDVNIDLTTLSNTSFKNYYEDVYYEYDENNNLIEKQGDNAVNINTHNDKYLYCEIKVTESPTDDWYENDTLHVNLKVPDGYNIVDYGIGYSANNYQLTYNMTIPKSKTGAFNLYGYVKDDKGNTANCIRLIKKLN